jgi:TRAP-type C4-dicarboxylate transport system permease small subunit
MMAGRSLRSISDELDKIAIVACVVLVVVMLAISTLGVFFEILYNIFGIFGAADIFLEGALNWLYAQTRPSLTRLFLPWLAMLSLTVAFKRGEHIAITFAVRRLPARALVVVKAINLTLIGLFGVALVWYGYGFFVNSTQLFMVSELLQVSHKWTAASIPVAGVIMCVHLMTGLALVEHRELELEAGE